MKEMTRWLFVMAFCLSACAATSNKTVGITVVNTNRPPVFDSIDNVTVNEGEAVNLEVRATDPDGDTVEVTASSLPAGSAFDGLTFTWLPGFDICIGDVQSEIFNVIFSADDGN